MSTQMWRQLSVSGPRVSAFSCDIEVRPRRRPPSPFTGFVDGELAGEVSCSFWTTPPASSVHHIQNRPSNAHNDDDDIEERYRIRSRLSGAALFGRTDNSAAALPWRRRSRRRRLGQHWGG